MSEALLPQDQDPTIVADIIDICETLLVYVPMLDGVIFMGSFVEGLYKTGEALDVNLITAKRAVPGGETERVLTEAFKIRGHRLNVKSIIYPDSFQQKKVGSLITDNYAFLVRSSKVAEYWGLGKSNN